MDNVTEPWNYDVVVGSSAFNGRNELHGGDRCHMKELHDDDLDSPQRNSNLQ